MRISKIFICGFIVFSSTVFSENSKNPFLVPSEREGLKSGSLNPEQCGEEKKEQIEMRNFDNFMENYIEHPEFHPLVLGDWSKRDIEISRYIGEVNGNKLYFNEEKQVYISLDLSKALQKQR